MFGLRFSWLVDCVGGYGEGGLGRGKGDEMLDCSLRRGKSRSHFFVMFCF